MTGTAAETRPLETRPPQWCWSRLSAFTEGALGFSMPRRRINLPVPYAVAQHRIVIALALINTTGWQADGREATLEVTALEEGRWWSVLATGTAHRSRADEHDARLLASPRDRPRLASDPPPDQLVLVSVHVHGWCEAGDTTLDGVHR